MYTSPKSYIIFSDINVYTSPMWSLLTCPPPPLPPLSIPPGSLSPPQISPAGTGHPAGQGGTVEEDSRQGGKENIKPTYPCCNKSLIWFCEDLFCLVCQSSYFQEGWGQVYHQSWHLEDFTDVTLAPRDGSISQFKFADTRLVLQKAHVSS